MSAASKPFRLGAADPPVPLPRMQAPIPLGGSARTISGSAGYAQKRFGIKITCRAVDGGVRCWRIA